ncbi:uncharacterized protein G2W53_013065 [Senna tora]|uniref:Uncharacterized protein n=1 Tax=Senna tora TaxID=362788 RepID=A0A834TYM5_9FABA|nr:uncharacterized protein G2W53_013065 [Senna tora]
MASAEGRAAYAANLCFTQDFMMPPNSSDNPPSVSKKLESNNSVKDHANSGRLPHNPNCDRLPDMKWWLHVKTNLGDEANYTCQRLNSWEAEFGSYCAGLVDDNIKAEGDQSIKSFDSFSCVGSADPSVEQTWNSSPTSMKNNKNNRMPKIEAALYNDVQFMPKKKDQGEFWFSDDHFLDWDITNLLSSEQFKVASSALEPHWIGVEKSGPWWRTAGKDELASLVAQKSLEHIENCDLPPPQIKHFRKTPSPYLEGVDYDKTLSSSLNLKAEKNSSSYVDSNTSGTPMSGCSSQDSDRLFRALVIKISYVVLNRNVLIMNKFNSLSNHALHMFSSNQSKDSSSTSKGNQINSEFNSKAELLEALCHSQTRAREAEKAAQQAYNEKEHILSLFFRQASQLFAYKQWLQLLQLENLCLQLRSKNQPLLSLFPQFKNGHRVARKRKSRDRRNGIRKCAVAFAVGLGLVGAGLLLGWTMGWMFPPI